MTTPRRAKTSATTFDWLAFEESLFEKLVSRLAKHSTECFYAVALY